MNIFNEIFLANYSDLSELISHLHVQKIEEMNVYMWTCAFTNIQNDIYMCKSFLM